MININDTKLKKIISKHRLKILMQNKIFGVIVTLTCVSLAYILLYNTKGGYFLSNDDTGMMKTVSGYSSGVPTSYHQFICTALGAFFELLYRIKPDVSWYSYVYVGFVIVCISTILYVMINAIALKNRWNRTIGVFTVIAYVSAISLYGVYSISWTVTSTFFGTAALTLLFSLSFPHAKKSTVVICVLSGLFILLNALIRFPVFISLLPFYILMVIYLIISNLKRFNIKTHIVLVVLFLALCVAVIQYDTIDSEYKEVYRDTVSHSDFELYRSRFSDYPIIEYDGNEEFYQSIGWDKDFYNISTNRWMYMDRRFNIDNLRKITEMSNTRTFSVTDSEKKEIALIKFFTVTFPDNQWKLLTLMVTGFALLGISGTVWCLLRKKREYLINSLMLCATNLLAILECLYLLNKGRYMFRVFLCASLPALFVSAMIVIVVIDNIDKLSDDNDSKNKHHHFSQKTIASVLFGMMIISVLSLVVVSHQNFNSNYKKTRDENNKLSTAIDEYCVAHKDCLYVHNGVASNDSQLFLDMSLRGCSQNLLFWGGTGVFSSGYYKTVGQYGYSEFYSDNLFDDKVYLICNYREIENTDFMDYMRSAYGDDFNCEKIDSIRNRAFVYKFSR